METFWTSKRPINGLRHFVLINRTKEKGKKTFLMVSVVDCEINLKITYKNLSNRDYWEKGWLNLPKNESITEDYLAYKSSSKENKLKKVFITYDSVFNMR